MNCAWEQFLRILPLWMRDPVDKTGKDKLLELRLRIESMPELVLKDRTVRLNRAVLYEDLEYCINAATAYSPWVAETSEKGYITAPGGHRIGICGSYASGKIVRPDMLCLRVARDFPGIAKSIAEKAESTLILGRPGSGKTTLLRDLIRQYSNSGKEYISVVDEREELFPRAKYKLCFHPGDRTDVLSGCSKKIGIEMVLRTMTPTIIAIDEITAQEDCDALIQAGWCGVNLLATAHAANTKDLMNRPIYYSLLKCGLFQRFIVMQQDKSWYTERSTEC